MGVFSLSSNYKRNKSTVQAINKLPIIILLLAVALFVLADLFFDFSFNWVDYAIVLIIALFGIKGYITGIINTIFSLVGYILGLLLSYLFTSKATLLLMQKTGLGEKIGHKLNELLPVLSTVGDFASGESESLLDVISNIPQVSHIASDNPLLEQLLTVTKSAADTGKMYSETVVTLNDLIVYSVLRIIVFLVLFIIIKLAIVILGRLLTKVLNTTALIGTANRTAGMALGFVVGILICYIAFVFVVPALGAIEIIKVPENYIDSLVLVWFNKLILLLF